jgi:hypothetical protein
MLIAYDRSFLTPAPAAGGAAVTALVRATIKTTTIKTS